MTSRNLAFARQRQAQVAPRRSEHGTMDDRASNAMTEHSDYGSEIDPNDIDESTVGDITVAKTAIYPSVEIQQSLEGGDEGVHTPSRPALLRWAHSSPARPKTVEIEYDPPSRRAFSVSREESPPVALAQAEEAHIVFDDDARAPLERFRTKPKKPLSVTDLVSPAWCELQYLYTLTRFGRKPRTQAMKAGSMIHQALEDEVHTVVPVQVTSKEDRFGLRIWNTIQGLRCLRETGLTRELEVWGVIEGQVVNGVIDELSRTCPDPELEEQLELSKAEKNGGILPLGQLSIEQAFAKAGATTLEKHSGEGAWVGALDPDRPVYVSDVKTRGIRSVPAGASLRPTWMQLMLYRKLLESLSLNTVDAETIFARYNVAPLAAFSEVFMLEVGASDVDAQNVAETSFTTFQSNEMRSHPNLLSLWSLMISEFQQTVLTISNILRAEFRYSGTGDIIGSELTVYDPDLINKYIKEEMGWWKGDRAAKGVEIEEAFKCRVCDFAEECTWRKTKIEEATEKHRLRRGKREKSAV